MTILDEALALAPLGPGEWSAHADARYAGAVGMFGGWTTAVMLRAVTQDRRASGTPSALTVNFIKAVPPGSNVIIRVRHAGGGKSLSFWTVELFVSGDDTPHATASAVLAQRRAGDAFSDYAMPDVPGPDGLPTFQPPAPFGQRTAMALVSGFPIFDRPDTKSVHWVREISGRAMDYAQLALLTDAYAPRVFYRSKTVRPASTITLSVYFHATAEEMAAVGDAYILIEAEGTRAEASTMGQRAFHWSRDGKLLATSEQMQWFR